MDGGHLINEGNDVAKELHETTDAHVLGGADAEDGIDASGHHALTDALAHFVFCELFCLEELLHESLIVFCGCFNQFFVKSLCALHLGIGNVAEFRFAAFFLEDKHLHENDVNQRVEAGTCGNGILHGNGFGTIVHLQLFNDSVIVTRVAVELIDKEDDGLLEFFRVAEMVLRTDLRTELTVDKEHGSVSHVKRGERCSHEIVGTRAVNDVEFFSFPLGVEDRGENGVAVVLFHGEIVRDCVFGSDASATFDLSAFKEEGFGESGFTGAVVAEQGNVFDFVRVVNLHGIRFKMMFSMLKVLFSVF